MVRARASTPEPCLFLPDVLIQRFSQSCMDDLAEDLAGNGEQSDALQLFQSQCPFYGSLTMSPGFHASGIVSLFHLSEYAHQKGMVFNFFSLESFCFHSICSTCLPTLHHFDGSFHLFHGRWIYTRFQRASFYASDTKRVI